jgi:hypothetical protein
VLGLSSPIIKAARLISITIKAVKSSNQAKYLAIKVARFSPFIKKGARFSFSTINVVRFRSLTIKQIRLSFLTIKASRFRFPNIKAAKLRHSQ